MILSDTKISVFGRLSGSNRLYSDYFLKSQLEIKLAAEPDKSCMHLIHNKIIFSGWIPVLALVFCHDCHAQSFLAELVHLSLV